MPEKLKYIFLPTFVLYTGQQLPACDDDHPDVSQAMSPPPTESEHSILSDGTPFTSTNDIAACRSCVELGSVSSSVTCEDSIMSSILSQGAIQFTGPADDLSPHHSPHTRVHMSSSEGNVMAVLGVARRYRGPSQSAHTSPSRNTRRNLEKAFEDATDSAAPVGAKHSLQESSSSSSRQKGKKMRVTKGISKTAKFFAMLRNRYRNGISSTVGSGLGDVVMDHSSSPGNLSPRRSRSMKHSRALSNNTEDVTVVPGERRPSGRGLTRSNSQHDALTVHVRGSMTPGDDSRRGNEGILNHMLSGSLEGLLTAVNTRLSGEWSQGSHKEEEGQPIPPRAKLCQSPSLFALTSFEGDDTTDVDGNSNSLTSSFSSPSLNSLMESSRNSASTAATSKGTDGVPSEVLETPLGEQKQVRGGDVSEKGRDMEESKKHQRESVGDSLSRTPSSSSMDSAGESVN